MKNTLNQIGLDKSKTEKLITELNELLSTYSIFYQNVRGFHWKIKGSNFFELHLKFEEYYNDAVIKVDEIAERILTLEGRPLHDFKGYLETASIGSAKNITDGSKAVAIILDNYKTLIQKERAILNLADTADDEGTNSLMSDYISETEKVIWMLRSYLA